MAAELDDGEKFSTFLAEPWPRVRVKLVGCPEDEDEFDSFLGKLTLMYTRAEKEGRKVEVVFDVSEITPIWCMSYVPQLVRKLKELKPMMKKSLKGTIVLTETSVGKVLVTAVLSAFSSGLPRKTELREKSTRVLEDAWFVDPVTEDDIADSGGEEERH